VKSGTVPHHRIAIGITGCRWEVLVDVHLWVQQPHRTSPVNTTWHSTDSKGVSWGMFLTFWKGQLDSWVGEDEFHNAKLDKVVTFRDCAAHNIVISCSYTVAPIKIKINYYLATFTWKVYMLLSTLPWGLRVGFEFRALLAKVALCYLSQASRRCHKLVTWTGLKHWSSLSCLPSSYDYRQASRFLRWGKWIWEIKQFVWKHTAMLCWSRN
jgi:hypothetical protein